MTYGGYEMVVDLEAQKCACRKWELSGIPCYHACACIAWAQQRFEGYIHKSYSKDAFLDCYRHIIEPICGETKWTPTEFPRPLPPAIKVPTGRPKKKRNKSTDVPQTNATKLTRKNTFMTCTYCKEANHNTRTCPAKVREIYYFVFYFLFILLFIHHKSTIKLYRLQIKQKAVKNRSKLG